MAKPDPGTFFREMLGQWEGIASQFGAELMKSGEFARTLQGATSAGQRAKDAANEAMSRALAAANMPSREEVVALGNRIQVVEERLERIEALLSQMAPPPGERPPKSKRKKKPSKKEA